MKVPLFRPWLGPCKEEILEGVGNSMDTGWLCLGGPNIAAFEKEFAESMGAKHAIAVNSGSSALLIALRALGVKEGDEVVVPNMTFVTTATSCNWAGAKPVFVDISLDSYCMDPKSMESKLTDKTKAIIPVHYSGHCADMDEILRIAKERNIPVLEDAAHAHLCKYKGKFVGTLGDISIFSFTPSKLMTTGEGGMILTNDNKLAEKCKLVRNFHEEGKFNYTGLGFNFRMTELAAIVGRAQLKVLPEAIKRRRELATNYNKAFSGIKGLITPKVGEGIETNYQVYTVRIDPNLANVTRKRFMELLQEKGVSSRLYYPVLHNQKVFNSEQEDKEFPNAMEFNKTALSLPIYAGMTEEEQNYVINAVKEVLQWQQS